MLLCIASFHLPSGGAELLFGNIKSHQVTLEAQSPTMKDLIRHVRDHLCKERPELFVTGDSV